MWTNRLVVSQQQVHGSVDGALVAGAARSSRRKKDVLTTKRLPKCSLCGLVAVALGSAVDPVGGFESRRIALLFLGCLFFTVLWNFLIDGQGVMERTPSLLRALVLTVLWQCVVRRQGDFSAWLGLHKTGNRASFTESSRSRALGRGAQEDEPNRPPLHRKLRSVVASVGRHRAYSVCAAWPCRGCCPRI